MLTTYAMRDVRPGWSIRVIAGFNRAPTWEQFKSNPCLAFGPTPIAVTALVLRVRRKRRVLPK